MCPLEDVKCPLEDVKRPLDVVKCPLDDTAQPLEDNVGPLDDSPLDSELVGKPFSRDKLPFNGFRRPFCFVLVTIFISLSKFSKKNFLFHFCSWLNTTLCKFHKSINLNMETNIITKIHFYKIKSRNEN